MSHLKTKKSAKRKRRKRGTTEISRAEQGLLKKLIPGI